MSKLILSNPVKPFGVNQPFGTNFPTYKQFGLKGHNGLDLYLVRGQPIYAAHDGIAFYQEDASQGHGVVIISDKPHEYKDGLSFFKTIYWHMCDPVKQPSLASPVYKAVGVNTGKSVPVKRGELIGYGNNTGFSSGDHLHFGLKPIKTGKKVKSTDAPDYNIGKWVNVEQDNGFLGSIDPTPYLESEQTVPGTSVGFTTAIQNLLKGGLSGVVFYAALAILNSKYKK